MATMTVTFTAPTAAILTKYADAYAKAFGWVSDHELTKAEFIRRMIRSHFVNTARDQLAKDAAKAAIDSANNAVNTEADSITATVT